jgi:hypothetical protein
METLQTTIYIQNENYPHCECKLRNLLFKGIQHRIQLLHTYILSDRKLTSYNRIGSSTTQRAQRVVIGLQRHKPRKCRYCRYRMRKRSAIKFVVRYVKLSQPLQRKEHVTEILRFSVLTGLERK